MQTSLLENLKGIQKERDITVREKTGLEKLLDIESEIVREYSKRDTRHGDKINEAYLSIYKELKERLKEVDYNEEDLKGLIYAKIDNEYDIKQSIALGLYTGSLLQLLTERNRQKGKRTIFYIDGKGSNFNYLFYFAKEVDNLTVENFSGEHICGEIGSYGGNAGVVLLKGIKGDWTGDGIGSDGGSAGVVLLKDIKGDHAGWGIGSDRGSIGVVLLKDIKGDGAGEKIGSYKGKVGKLYCHNVSNISHNIKAKRIIKGEEALKEYEKIIKGYRIDEILKLVDSMEGKDHKGLLDLLQSMPYLTDHFAIFFYFIFPSF